MRITKETIDQIYTAIDIVEVVGDFVALKKRGANFAGLSPFTNEKTPSFYVSPAKQIFKCFSTGKGGDAVKFLMEVDSLTYVEALKYLAKKYSIEVKFDREQTDEQQAEQSERDSLYIVLNYAKDYYKDILYNNPDGKAIGLSYFKERGLNEKTINDFELGFALDGWDNLLKDAEKNQYSLDILEKAGLIKISENGKKFDFFRNRVMYSIHNITGKVIALAGRILNNEKGTAKYINSPETELYHKSKVLYGMFQAKQAIRNDDNCLLVEGYMDVLSLYQAGITNVVASSGTSLTEEQVKLISRYTKNITVLYDGDQAGIKAAIRGTDLILDSGLNIKVAVFPDGDDPDSYVNKVGETAFREFMKVNAKDFITFKTEMLLKDASDDPIKRAEVIHEVVNSIAKVKDNIQRAIYFKRCSQLLDIEEQIIISEYNKIQLANRKKEQDDQEGKGKRDALSAEMAGDEAIAIQPAFESSNPDELAEREIIRILLEYSQFPLDEQTPLYQTLFEFITVNNLHFTHPVYYRILDIFKVEVALGNIPGLDYFLNHPDKELEQYLMDMLTEKHELSSHWQDKFQVFIPAKDQDKVFLLEKSISRLKFEKTRSQYRENQQKLMKLDYENIDETELLLETQKIIKSYQMQFALELGIVVSG
jgi:DNA primase